MIEKQVKDREEAMDSDISPAETSWLFAFSWKDELSDWRIKQKETGLCLAGEMDLGLTYFKRVLEEFIGEKRVGQSLMVKTAPQVEYEKYCNKLYFKNATNSLEEIIIYREIHVHLVQDIPIESLEPFEKEVRWTTNTSKYGIRERSKMVTNYRYNLDSCEADIKGQTLHIWGTLESLINILDHTIMMSTDKSYGLNDDRSDRFGTLPPQYHQIKAGNIPIYSYTIEGTCFEFMGGRPS
ncbi:MAG: hypothetical protein HRT90_11800 [Candidatus Margulisbacteria bacterium]|nr:hypothetical protein [Candidatus Margulisiibacteriota bacterium]